MSGGSSGARWAAIDVGTNSVLLLVAERDPLGRLVAVDEALEMTRLGEGVDRTGRLGERALRETVAAVERFAARARALGAEGLAVVATSAARDASNGADFLAAIRKATGVDAEILSGEEEAALTFRSAFADFGPGPVVALDIGGGSTEVIFGRGAEVGFSRSFDLGAVRLTERCIRSDPPGPEELRCVEQTVTEAFREVPAPEPGAVLVGLAGTVTTLCAIHLGLERYDARRVHGARLTLDEVRALEKRLSALPLEERMRLPGLPPRRADVIVAGAMLLRIAMERLGFDEVIVSDKGVRWGLLEARFGG